MAAPTVLSVPVVLSTDATDIALIPLVIPRAEMAAHLPPALEELFAALDAQHITPTGAWFAHHTELPATHFHFRACVPTASPIHPAGRVEAGFLPPLTVARATYRGPYGNLPRAWAEFRAWTVAQQLPTDTQVIERYTVNPSHTLNPDELVTELLWPLVASRSN